MSVVEQQFNSAANFIQSNHQKFAKGDLLTFYAFYKQSTVGPVTSTEISRPSFFKLQERTKWDAWAELKSMDKETAMKSYVEKLTALEPSWTQTQDTKSSSGSFGVSVSRPRGPEEIVESEKSIVDFIREANVDKLNELLKMLDSSDLNSLDENGLGLLHWAADIGHENILKAILETPNIQIDLLDKDGQTPLHYACSCSHRKCVEVLLKFGASKSILDFDGTSCLDAADDEEIKSLLS